MTLGTSHLRSHPYDHSREANNANFWDAALPTWSPLKSMAGYFSCTCDGVKTVDVVCGIFRGFTFGSDDICQLAQHLDTFYGSFLLERFVTVTLALKPPALRTSKVSSNLSSFTDLAECSLRIKDLKIHKQHDGAISDTTWSSLCLDSF